MTNKGKRSPLGSNVLDPRLVVVPPNSWDDLVEELEITGKLSRRDFADRLRVTDKAMPEAIRCYLADALESKKEFARPRNRNKDKELERLKERLFPVLERYTRYIKHIAPHATAITPTFIERFAAKHGISARRVDEILHPRK